MSQTSCNKSDDDKPVIPAPSLLGKWNYSKEGTSIGGTETLEDYSGNESGCSKDYTVFNANNTITDVDFDSFDSPCEELSDSGTYAVNGNTIIVDFGDGPVTAQILNLSYTELKVKVENDITVFVR